MNDAAAPSSLRDLLDRAARRTPERGVTLLDRRGRDAGRRTWPEILASATRAAGRLAGAGVGPGERVLTCLPTSWALIETWLGSVQRGALPVALAPGGALGGGDAHLAQLRSAVETVRPRLLVASPPVASHVEASDTALATELLTPEALSTTPEAAWSAGRALPDEPAFLQLTSGSTGHRRAAIVSNRAAVHNAMASDQAIGAPHGGPCSAWADAMVSWLPLHHDMGLVGCLLFAAWCGFELVLMPPEAFLARPLSWLRELAARGTTLAPAPNFAYQLVVERPETRDATELDLSGWRAAMVGAEMVRPDTMAAFCELTAARGFRPEAVRPCYGLAESTLAVTFDVAGRGVRTRPLPAGADEGLDLGEVTCVGRAVEGMEVAITDPSGRPVADGTVGEVLVRGPSVFSGYYEDEDATSDALEGGWLRTGDLGFMHDGELFPCGRTKELLIIRGQNLMPHELEWIAESASGTGGGLRCGAFSVSHGGEGEQAVLVMEVKDAGVERLRALEADVRQRVGRELSLTLADVALVRRGGIPKTTSGKVKRRELRHLYLEGRLERIRVDA